MTIRAFLPAAVFGALLVAGPVHAQEPQDEPVPTMTNDDVPSAPVAQQDEGAEGKPAPQDEGLTPEERADAEAAEAGDEGGQEAGGGAAPGRKTSREELQWRSDYAAAEERARAAERKALDAELQANEMKHELQSSGSVAERNAAAAALDAKTTEIEQARSEAAAARAEAERLKNVGASARYKAAPGPGPVDSSGGANRGFHQQAVQRATTAQADAERRVAVYQNRVLELRQQMLNTGGSGDNFALMKMQEQLTQAEGDLEKAQTDLGKATTELEAARAAAAAAGVRVP